MADTITVAAPADFHVHLRQGTFTELVGKHVREGGFGLAYVMVRLAALWLDVQNLTGGMFACARITAKFGATD